MTMRKILITLTLLFTSTLSFGQYLTKEKALEDLDEFKILMEEQSSYYQVSNFDFAKPYKEIERTILSKDSISIHFLAFEYEKIIAETIDRHTGIEIEDFDEDAYPIFNLHFPFLLAPLNGKAVALINKPKGEYEYYSAKYPYLQSINGININEFIDKYAYTKKHTPAQAKLNEGLRAIVGDIGELFFKQGESEIKKVSLTLTDGQKTKKIVLPLTNEPKMWIDIGALWISRKYSDFRKDKNFDLSKLDKWITESIAYLAIPMMIGYEKNPNLEAYLKATMEKYRGAKALIVDIRSNGGGTREILKTLSGYFVQPEQSPWVANVAYVRTDQFLDEDIASMQARYLYNYNSEFISDKDREAIDIFNKNYETEFKVDANKFSEPYYMVLHSNDSPLQCPIYILVNEATFSAASVFTSVFKGLPNVKIVGVNTNGSSGRSNYFYLKNSNIRVKLSTMLSFQRNGKTLDGNGTKPDIVIERDENQVLGKSDSQLEKLVELIKN